MDAKGAANRLQAAFNKTMAFHGQDGFLLRAKGEAGWLPVNLTVSRLHVAPKPLGLVIARDDTDRRAALTQTRRVEAELRTVLENSPAALWSAERVPGPDVFGGWHFRYVSGLLARIAGRPDGFLEHPLQWAEVVYPADRGEYRAAVRRLLTGGRDDADQTYRVVHPDGAVRWVRDWLRVVRDRTGRPTRLDGSLSDITARHTAEEGLRQSERRFRALIEKSRDGVVLIDEQGIVTYTSAAAKATLGYEPEDLVGKSGFDLVWPDDLTAARESLLKTLSRPGEDVPGRFRAQAGDGTVRILETSSCNRLADPSVRAVVVNYRDVTDRDREARELERHHALLVGLLDSVPDVICYKGRDLRFQGGNAAFEELAGRPVADTVGRYCHDLFPNTEWAENLAAVEPEVLDTGRSARAREWVGYPDGRRACLDLVISPLRGDDGGVIGVIVVGRDVTDRERLEDALRESQKLEAVGRLAGGIAHDFNNLLTVILGNLELIRAGFDPAETDDLLASSARAARQAAELTRQMLGFARRQPLRPAVIDLNAVAREVLSLLRRTIDPRVGFAFHLAADLPPVVADPVQVQQVLMNLCLNARDVMPDGGTLTVATEHVATPAAGPGEHPSPGGYARLSITDTGPGMPDEVREKIFEPFFTTKEVGKGTGLGLAVVHGVAAAHGGWVECDSGPGRGTRFDIYLPCDPDAAPPPVTAEPDAVGDHGRGRTVLVADDEAGVRTLARGGLEQHGYEVLAAADGAEAVEVFGREADRIDVVVLDATMPRMTGRQAFDAIRAIAPGVPRPVRQRVSPVAVLPGPAGPDRVPGQAVHPGPPRRRRPRAVGRGRSVYGHQATLTCFPDRPAAGILRVSRRSLPSPRGTTVFCRSLPSPRGTTVFGVVPRGLGNDLRETGSVGTNRVVYDAGHSHAGRSAGGFASPAGRPITARSFVVVFVVSPPVARKNPDPSGPASMFNTGLASAVNRAFASGTQSPFAGFTHPFPKSAFRTFVAETLFRRKSSMNE